MNSAFGEVFLFLTNLAWKSRMIIPVLVTTVFMIMDVRLQIEINIQSGQVAAAQLQQLDDDDDEPVNDEADNDLEEEHTPEDSNERDHDFMFYCDIETVADDEDEEEDDEDDNAANQIRRSLGLS